MQKKPPQCPAKFSHFSVIDRVKPVHHRITAFKTASHSGSQNQSAALHQHRHIVDMSFQIFRKIIGKMFPEFCRKQIHAIRFFCLFAPQMIF